MRLPMSSMKASASLSHLAFSRASISRETEIWYSAVSCIIKDTASKVQMEVKMDHII